MLINVRMFFKKYKTILLITISVLLVAAIATTFAFFLYENSLPAKTPVGLENETVSKLDFDISNELFLQPGSHNLNDQMGNLVTTATATATLYANADATNVTRTYNLSINIFDNEFVYTSGNTPEILLTVVDPDGNNVENITGLDYVTHNGVSGFDVTTYNGTINIAVNYQIITNLINGLDDDWTITLTMLNLDTDQSLNAESSLSAEIILQETEIKYFNETILNNNGGIDAIVVKGTPDFNVISTTNDGMYATQDDYGTSYYFRGAVDDNWVKFAGFYWRIIRVNGDGSVRIIYSGTDAPTEEEKVFMTTSAKTTIGSSPYNLNQTVAEQSGYMYTVGEQHGISTSSDIKIKIDDWYENNILNTVYNELVSDAIYCDDRTAYKTTSGSIDAKGYGNEVTQYFGSYIRNFSSKNPSLICPTKEDAFTVDDILNGNGGLDYPVATLSADEVSFAGGRVSVENKNYYLYVNTYVWTISSYTYTGQARNVLTYHVGYLDNSHSANDIAVRPVISLNKNVLVSGNGTWNNPYVVEVN